MEEKKKEFKFTLFIERIFKFIFSKETILYLVCGVLTTVVNLVALKLFTMLMGEKLYLLTNSFAWVIAVVFAYITNKLLVFESKSWKGKVLAKEIPSFFAARVASYFIEEGGLWLFMSPLKFEGKAFDFHFFSISGLMIAKLIVAVVVVILNYVLSKFLIFKKKDELKDTEDVEGE